MNQYVPIDDNNDSVKKDLKSSRDEIDIELDDRNVSGLHNPGAQIQI